MAIRRQQLQRFQSKGTSDHDNDGKKHAVRVSQTERQSSQRKCREMFELRARDDGTGVDRGERRIHNKSQCQPARDNRHPLNHRW